MIQWWEDGKFKEGCDQLNFEESSGVSVVCDKVVSAVEEKIKLNCKFIINALEFPQISWTGIYLIGARKLAFLINVTLPQQSKNM